ncbi:phosphodiester glycosidase family protein [Daejeonella sp.]|uniref:phosphodiester glycosidase family protein n=1 Tax=Daejeonella sp. TaxID=2805397 RepID=UPI0027236BFF|nr:phosphodiester glycosidase family protein [Daejeonella sp.]MDO8994401.1 phosphodiester glycosidase family protein [Daejeonella sp.]MDP2413974.1 phosphodiester glycosidase family protein [Daejeonella sp.]
MKIFSITALLLLFITGGIFAQSDSLVVLKADWKKEKIASGVRLKTFWFNKSLFNSNQNISILEIKQKGSLFFDLGYDPKILQKTSDFGKQNNALAALNGTFFDIANGGSVDYIRANGLVINENRLGKSGNRAGHQESALVFNEGKLSIAKWNGKYDWEQSIEAEDIMVSGPLLILHQTVEKLDTANTFNKTRHPRTAVAITKNKRVLLITVDGRNENSAGMSLFELTKLMRWLNAADAINLDGGGSTTLWINNYMETGVVNFPTDNRKWDHEGERKVANVVLLKKK